MASGRGHAGGEAAVSAKRRPIRERGRPIWISAPSGRELDELQAAWEAERSRTITMPEVVERVLAERRELLAVHAKVMQP